MSPPPPDLVVDLDDDAEGMIPDIAREDQQEAGTNQRLAPAGVSASGRRLSDATYKMELDDQINAFIVEVGIRPANMRDIQDDGRLLHMWRGMLRDMYNLMQHGIGATTLVM